MSSKRVGILISGRGSNMAKLVERARQADCAYEVACVISNRPDAKGLETAAANGIATAALDHKALGSREALDDAMHEALLAHGCELVACAGFMRIMTGAFIGKWAGRMINIHPSLLPALRGLRMIRNANMSYMVPLQDTWPENRLGPMGDGPKLQCATCHQGVAKPLYGAPMAKDYPELKGGG